MSNFDERYSAWESKVEKGLAKNKERKEKFISGGNSEVKRLYTPKEVSVLNQR